MRHRITISAIPHYSVTLQEMLITAFLSFNNGNKLKKCMY